MNVYRGAERNMASERAKRWREREEGSGEGRDSGKGVRGAGRREGNAGRISARKRPHPVKDAAGVWGEGVGSVSVESTVRADSPRVNGGRGG